MTDPAVPDPAVLDPAVPDPAVPDPAVARARADRHRPAYHFAAPAGWLNDPNGLGWRDGVYHLFYQYNPHAAVHHRIHWGHATSTDLVRWTDQPVALVPGESGPDADGCWSGVLVDDDGTPTIIYSGRHDERELPCLATGSPDVRQWTPWPGNPVIAQTPPGLDVTEYRDHCVWREGDRWRQLVGAGVRGRGGAVLLYDSQDLRSWTYRGELHVGDAASGDPGGPEWTGTVWECVDLFRLGHGGLGDGDGRDVLVFSAWDQGRTLHPLAWTGDYADDRFLPARLHRLDLGGRHFYAPQSFRAPDGRRVVLGWLQEARSDAAVQEVGWSGVLSVPRTVTVGADGGLCSAPVEEVDSLRHSPVVVPDRDLRAGERLAAPGLHGEQVDLEVTVRLEVGASVALDLLVGDRPGPDGQVERTRLLLTRSTSGCLLGLDRSASSHDTTSGLDLSPGSGPVRDRDGEVDLRVLVDRSALEAFAGGIALTTRVYPVADAAGIEVSCLRGAVSVRGLRVWQMHGVEQPHRVRWPR